MWLRRIFLVLVLLTARAGAHDGLELPPPSSEPEAWNVLTLCRANLDALIAGQQWAEIPIQAALCMQAARFLREKSGAEPPLELQRTHLQELENGGLFLIRASLKTDPRAIARAASGFTAAFDTAATDYDDTTVQAIVFSCPMCQGVRELKAETPCFKCGMALVPRIIPASSLYNTPGEPSIALTPTLDHPLTVGQPSTVTLRFARKKDGAPVTPDDLLVVHTERIHLLIIDESLTDYHHEHPVPSAMPGDYTFTFTPRQPGPCRVFADVVPRLSSVQEYPVCDLPAAVDGLPLTDRATVSVSEVDGLRYTLHWQTGGLPIRAQQPVSATITVTNASGEPFKQLEPIMGAYAHLVGFYEDRATVLHIHPSGIQPQTPADRGGPTFNFRFYAPKAGFIRLYSQVQIGGKSVFAPFGLTVEP